jgi:hypothetical protein
MNERGSILEPHYTLKEATEKFFPNGPLTAASLRNEIRKGRLQATMPAGKLLVTERALVEMLEQCRVRRNHHGFTSSVRNAAAARCGSSETERIGRAQAAIRATERALKNASPDTSMKNTRHPKP